MRRFTQIIALLLVFLFGASAMPASYAWAKEGVKKEKKKVSPKKKEKKKKEEAAPSTETAAVTPAAKPA